jgi:hypothetical protein
MTSVSSVEHGQGGGTVRRSTALRLLSPTHARILALADQGLDEAEVARRLGVDENVVGPLLRVAQAKLAALEALDEPGSDQAWV